MEQIHINDKGNAGATFACFQSLGMVPVSIDFAYILVKIGAT
jgi:hypothetical protein